MAQHFAKLKEITEVILNNKRGDKEPLHNLIERRNLFELCTCAMMDSNSAISIQVVNTILELYENSIYLVLNRYRWIDPYIQEEELEFTLEDIVENAAAKCLKDGMKYPLENYILHRVPISLMNGALASNPTTITSTTEWINHSHFHYFLSHTARDYLA